MESYSSLSNDEEPTREVKGTGLYKMGGVVPAIWNYFRIILLCLGTKWRMTTTAGLLRGKGKVLLNL